MFNNLGLLLLVSCLSNIKNMSNIGTQQYWMDASLPDIPFEAILKKFDDEVALDPPEGIPFILDEAKFIEDNFSVTSIILDHSKIFRFKDTQKKEYYQLDFQDDKLVIRSRYDLSRSQIGEEKYYRLYPFSIEIGVWAAFENGERVSINKDTKFTFLEAMERVRSSTEYEDFDLFHAEREIVDIVGVDVDCWKLEYHIYPNATSFFYSVATGKMVLKSEGVIEY